MGQMIASMAAIGQEPRVNGSGFVLAVSRKAALVHMLEKNPDAVFEIDIAVTPELIEHFI